MEKILIKENIKVYCLHCRKDIDGAWICKMDSIIGTRYALICSHCERLIKIFSPGKFFKVENSCLFIDKNNLINNLEIKTK